MISQSLDIRRRGRRVLNLKATIRSLGFDLSKVEISSNISAHGRYTPFQLSILQSPNIATDIPTQNCVQSLSGISERHKHHRLEIIIVKASTNQLVHHWRLTYGPGLPWNGDIRKAGRLRGHFFSSFELMLDRVVPPSS
jgi:hypothetical protein